MKSEADLKRTKQEQHQQSTKQQRMILNGRMNFRMLRVPGVDMTRIPAKNTSQLITKGYLHIWSILFYIFVKDS